MRRKINHTEKNGETTDKQRMNERADDYYLEVYYTFVVQMHAVELA